MAKKTTPVNYERVFQVKFGSYSGGVGEHGTFGVRLDGNIDETLDDLRDIFVANSLECCLSCDMNSGKDVEGQKTFSGKQDKTIKFTADCKGYNVRDDCYPMSLKMPKKGVDVNTLDEFAGKRGVLKINVKGPASSDGDGKEE